MVKVGTAVAPSISTLRISVANVRLAYFGETGASYLAPDLHHRRVDVAPDMHVANATRCHAVQLRQHGASDLSINA